MIKVNCATCITFQDVNQSLVCISYNCTSCKTSPSIIFTKLQTTHQRPLASGFSGKTANPRMSRDYGFAVEFAVFSSRLKGRKGIQR